MPVLWIAFLFAFSASANSVESDGPSPLETRKAALDSRLAELKELERQYIESEKKLSADWISPEAMTQRMASAQEGFLEEWDRWIAAQKAHQALIDRLNVEKFDYFVHEVAHYAEVADREFEKAGIESGDDVFESLQNVVREYTSHLDRYGTPKDTFRLAAIRSVFAKAKEYFGIVRKVITPASEKWARTQERIAAFPKRLWNNLKLLALTPDAVKLGADIAVRGGGKINATVNAAFIKAAKLQGYDVKILGKENLAQLAVQEGTVNILAKVHRGPVLDNMVLAHLGLKDYVFVTSFGSVIPKSYADRIKDNPGVAFVGPGFPGGVETVTEKTIQNPERIMVNYVEGSIGNAGETRPITLKFSTSVIPTLRKKGYRVNVIPVTSQTASFLKKDIGPDLVFGKAIEAKVHAPISDEMITWLESNGRLEDLGVLIRATWLAELETNVGQGGTLIEGALSLDGIDQMLVRYLGFDYEDMRFCPNLLLKEKI